MVAFLSRIVQRDTTRNEDLRLQGPFLLANKKEGGLWASGKGTADLPRQTIDYRLLVKVAEDASRKGITIPIDVVGPFSNLAYNLDYGAVTEQLVKKQIDKKIEQKKQKLEDKLKKKLKGLFRF